MLSRQLTTCYRPWSRTISKHGNELGIDPKRIIWKRVMDINDRQLRQIVVGLGSANGLPLESGFITASEVMAILCLADGISDLKSRQQHTCGIYI